MAVVVFASRSFRYHMTEERWAFRRGSKVEEEEAWGAREGRKVAKVERGWVGWGRTEQSAILLSRATFHSLRHSQPSCETRSNSGIGSK